MASEEDSDICSYHVLHDGGVACLLVFRVDQHIDRLSMGVEGRSRDIRLEIFGGGGAFLSLPHLDSIRSADIESETSIMPWPPSSFVPFGYLSLHLAHLFYDRQLEAETAKIVTLEGGGEVKGGGRESRKDKVKRDMICH